MSSLPCARCKRSPRRSPTQSYCKDCHSAFEKARRVPAPPKTHCKRGHEFTAANTYLWRGIRNCRTCRATFRPPDNREWRVEYQQSERGRKVGAKARARYRASDKGKAAERQRSREYAQTEHGRVVRRAVQAKRRSGPEAHRLVREIADGLHRCYWCGALAEVADHVLPLAMARACGIPAEEADRYVAPMCSCCHKVKTGRDVADIRRIHREQQALDVALAMMRGG